MTTTLIAIAVCAAIEFLGPFIAESRMTATPWNPFHITERYGTLIVITLGEGVVGTVAVLQAQIGRTGWTAQTAVLGATALGVTFAMWWLYSVLPNGEALDENRRRCFAWGYGMIPVFMACAAVGAGMHLIATWLNGETRDSELTVMLAAAVPLAIFTVGVIAAHYYLVGTYRMEATLIGVALVPILAGVVLVAVGVPLLIAVVVGSLAPVLPTLVIEFSEKFATATL